MRSSSSLPDGPNAAKEAAQSQPPSGAPEAEQEISRGVPNVPAGRLPARVTSGDILALQRTTGNRALQRVLTSGGHADPRQVAPLVIQRKVVTQEERATFLQTYPVAAELVDGIDPGAADATILDALVNNFVATSFSYTMSFKQGTTFLRGSREGDCATLSSAFVEIAKNYFGIEDIRTESKRTDYFVPGGGLVLDNAGNTGNVDGGAHWVFTTHTWVVGPDRTRDMLFRGVAVDQSRWIDMTGQGKEEGVEYRHFGDEYTIFEYRKMGGLDNRYTASLRRAIQGKVEDEEEAKRIYEETWARTKAAQKKKKFCFLTTACVEARGLPDDCHELTVLRRFRDDYMACLSGGQPMIDEYYAIAPEIIRRIESTGQARQIFSEMYFDIADCVALIDAGRNADALSRYASLVIELKQQWL